MALTTKTRLTVSLLFLLAAFVLFVTLRYLWRQGGASDDLYKPAITAAHVGGIPVMKDQAEPIEAMLNLATEVTCDSVPPAHDEETASFRISGFGNPVEGPACKAAFRFTSGARTTPRAAAGDKVTLTIEYLVTTADGTVRTVDSMAVLLLLVPDREYLRVRNLETASLQPVNALTVPQQVIPYVHAALRLEGKPEDYVVLFFVQPVGVDDPVLQILVPEGDPRGFDLNEAPLKWFRSWGDGIEGYAAWPGGKDPSTGSRPYPIQVGNRDELRQAFEIFAALFRRTDVTAFKLKALDIRVEGDRVVANSGAITLADVRNAAWNGWVSPGLRVVRSDATAAPPATWNVERK